MTLTPTPWEEHLARQRARALSQLRDRWGEFGYTFTWIDGLFHAWWGGAEVGWQVDEVRLAELVANHYSERTAPTVAPGIGSAS